MTPKAGIATELFSILAVLEKLPSQDVVYMLSMFNQNIYIKSAATPKAFNPLSTYGGTIQR